MNEAGHKLQILSEAREIAHFEQTMFWNRFIAFSALNAGLFAAMGVREYSFMLAGMGLILSSAWSYIQWRSRKDVMKSKVVFHRSRREAGLFFSQQEEVDFSNGQPDNHFSSKRIAFNVIETGVLTSIFILIAWVYILFIQQ